MIEASDAIARIARPEYTGDDRCLPCTIVNVAIATGLAIGLGVVSVPLGVVAFALFLGIIYLRGYLIPGTPTLTRRYLPERVLAWFGKQVERTVTIETAAFDDAADALSAADVVVRGPNRLELTAGFRERWRDRLATEGESDERRRVRTPDGNEITALFDADDVESRGEAAYEIDGSRLVRWESKAALAADVAADRELRADLEGWTALDPDDRRDVLAGLRLLWDRCPVCDGPLETTTERLEHCCRRPHVAVDAVCEDCGRLLVSQTVSETSSFLEWLPTQDGTPIKPEPNEDA